MLDLMNMMEHSEYTYMKVNSGLRIQYAESDNPDEYLRGLTTADTTYGLGEFEYQFNQHGFRSPEFSEPADLKILVMGCSFTQGTGLPWEDTWGNIIGEEIQKRTSKSVKVFSIAKGGTGIDFAASSLAWILSTEFKPDLVLFLMPSESRFNFISRIENEHIHNICFLPNNLKSDRGNEVYKKRIYSFYDGKDRIQRVFMNLQMIENLCAVNGIPYFSGTWCDATMKLMKGISDVGMNKTKNSFNPDMFVSNEMFLIANRFYKEAEEKYKETIARDWAHPGPRSQYVFAKSMMEFMETKAEFKQFEGKLND